MPRIVIDDAFGSLSDAGDFSAVEAEHGEPVRPVAGKHDERVAAVQQLPHPFRQRRRLGRGLIELSVKCVEQPPDRVGVVTVCEANLA